MGFCLLFFILVSLFLRGFIPSLHERLREGESRERETDPKRRDGSGKRSHSQRSDRLCLARGCAKQGGNVGDAGEMKTQKPITARSKGRAETRDNAGTIESSP